MRGAKFLKTTGILLIIFGGITLISFIIQFLGSVFLPEAVGTALIVASILSSLVAALDVVAGIIGIRNCNNPYKANVCLVFGIILVSIQVIGDVLSVVGGQAITGFFIFTCILGLVLPILYLIGAIKNKNS